MSKVIKFKGQDIPKEIRTAIVEMMKFMVSNDWAGDVPFEEISYWLSSGTGLSQSFIKDLVGDEKLYDEKYKAGMKSNPFKEYDAKNVKSLKKDELIR